MFSIRNFRKLTRHICATTRSGRRRTTYIAENLIGLPGPDGVLLLWVARPLVQVGAVQDIAQHVLAPLGHLVSDDVRREVDFGLGLVVVLLVDPL